MTMDSLLRLAAERDATDLHLTVGLAPHLRIHSRLTELDSGPLTAAGMRELTYGLLTPEQIEEFERERELDFALSIEHVARFRVNLFYDRGEVGMAARRLPLRILSLEELGLPVDVMSSLCRKPKGLVLVTGSTGSGKTTTLASMVEHINTTREAHVVTIEDPIEYLYTSRQALINQREVGRDTRTFGRALKYVLRQDPDVILIGEMRDLETIEAALSIAETGHLVLATLHTSDVVQTVNRIVDVFPSNQQNQVRMQLSLELVAVVSQQLVPRASGVGRVLAAEILVATHAVRSLIREQRLHQLYTVIQTGQREGMRTMNQALKALYEERAITLEEALARSSDPAELERMLTERASR